MTDGPSSLLQSREVYRHRGHATIRGYWEHFYRDDPDLYDRFALSSVQAVREVESLFGFEGARVLVLSSGTGKDALEIARTARHVVGVEPSHAMREYAVTRQRELGAQNVEFRDGVAEDLSGFADHEFDRAVSVHGVPFPEDTNRLTVRGCLRVVRPGGVVVFVSTTPGWRMDHQRPRTSTEPAEPDFLGQHLQPFGFSARDVVVTLDYGSLEEALATWGFIYGDEAIDYLLDRQTSRLNWSLRIWHRQV